MVSRSRSRVSDKKQKDALSLETKIYKLNFPFKIPASDVCGLQKLRFQSPFFPLLERKLAEFKAKHKFPLENIFFGVFQILLFRYSGQHNFVIGAKHENRVEPIHVNCHGKESFLDLTSRLESSLEKPHDNFLRRGSEQCQVLFSFSKDGLDDTGKNLVDLVFYIEKKQNTHVVHVGAARKVFQLETIESMIGHYCKLLESVLDHPHREINALGYLTDNELHLLSQDLSIGVEEAYPEDAFQHFESLVKKNPTVCAIKYREQSLTYIELDQKANQVAHILAANGITHGSVVGVCTYYDPTTIACIFAILKLGATYLPLDPEYPEANLNMMIQDANPQILITRSPTIEKFKGFLNLIVNLDTDSEEIEKSPSSLVSKRGFPENPAYIIYTSGSTGKPKGILISYASLPHLCLERQQYYPKKTITLLLGSISFDVSILGVFHTLMTGGMLSIPKQSEKIDGEALIKNIEDNNVNFFICVPSFYSMLLEQGIVFSRSLENVSLAGEVIPNSLPPLHAKFAPHAKLINEYGPSEVALGSTFAQIYNPETEEINPIVAGKPLPNTEVYVLDTNLQLVPIGMKGEICLGGKGLAMGYLNKRELTAEKFIMVSLPGKGLTSLYRTGDFGRWLPDRNLEFLGRMDYQVKIRGHRVELGEVEAVICQCKEIDEAVVKVERAKDHQGYLVAYFTTIGKGILSVSELRQYMNQLLPKSSVPSHFMQLEHFPRTHNRKIDRKALPVFSAVNVADEKTPSRVGVKEILVEIWKKALNLQKIGLDDNFFDIGGNSLLLANIQTVVKDVLKINVPIIECFRYSTINSFTKYLESLNNQGQKIARPS